MSNETSSGEAGSSGMGFVDVEPSMPLCIALSAFGGFLEVSSTMCLAYPEYKAKLGTVYTKCQQRLHMVVNLSLMGVASVAYIAGSFYGPVALSVPTVMVSKLLFNLLIMGFVLRMDTFSKNQKVGTYCIACAILTLPSIGPKDQADLVPSEIILELPAIVWSAALFIASFACCCGMVALKRRAAPPPEWVSMAVYVTAQVTSAVIGTSVSKMFATSEGVFLYTLFPLAIIFAAINVVSLIFAATTVDQGVFVPMQTCATLIINMVTGLVVWQDLTTIGDNLSAYLIVHLIMLLGIWLLAPEDALAHYKGANQFQPEIIAGAAMGENPVLSTAHNAGVPTLRSNTAGAIPAQGGPGSTHGPVHRITSQRSHGRSHGAMGPMPNDEWASSGKSTVSWGGTRAQSGKRLQPPVVETGARTKLTRSLSLSILPAIVSSIAPQLSNKEQDAWRGTFGNVNLHPHLSGHTTSPPDDSMPSAATPAAIPPHLWALRETSETERESSV